MSKKLKVTFIVIGSIIAGSILLLVGLIIGRSTWNQAAFWPGSMMSGYPDGTGRGMMGSGMMGGYGPGMMSGSGGSGLSNLDPLTIEQASEAVEGYLSGLDNPDLELGEVMIFDNHAYAQIIEKGSGIGALEVLVDPVTLSVYPEHGPNMMWNLKYGMMSGWDGYRPGMMGMMGGYGFRSQGSDITSKVSADMPVNPEQAVDSVQRYLDEYLPGLQADDHVDPFYGYYTLHVLRDGEVAGMLSVNGYTAQVFLHTWHGDFVEMSAE